MDTLTLVGANAKADYYDPETWEVFLREGNVIDQEAADRLAVLRLAEVEAALHPSVEVKAEPVEEVSEHAGQRWAGRGINGNAVARVLLIKPGTGAMRVNGKPAAGYFEKTPQKGRVFLDGLMKLPLVREELRMLDVVADVRGSCETCLQQVHAVAHGLASALWAHDPKFKVLRGMGYGQRKVGKGKRFEEG